VRRSTDSSRRWVLAPGIAKRPGLLLGCGLDNGTEGQGDSGRTHTGYPFIRSIAVCANINSCAAWTPTFHWARPPPPPLTCFHTWYGESENMRLAGNEVRVPTVHTKPGGPGYPRLPRTTRMEEVSAPNETNVGIRGDLECTYRPHQSTDKTRNWLRQRGHRHPCDISPPGTACHSSAGCR
jgi:hypothetical protein